jgi:hypothetical protein
VASFGGGTLLLADRIAILGPRHPGRGGRSIAANPDYSSAVDNLRRL